MSSNIEEMQQLSFMIILYEGNERSASMEASSIAKNYENQDEREKIEEEEKEFALENKEQTNLLQKEASGEKNEISVILIHAQDHLMNSMTVKDLAKEMIDMYEKIKQMEA